jgi:hypothetical protein
MIEVHLVCLSQLMTQHGLQRRMTETHALARMAKLADAADLKSSNTILNHHKINNM